jgi:hypothetical protein
MPAHLCGCGHPMCPECYEFRESVRRYNEDNEKVIRVLQPHNRGCICPPTSEQTCKSSSCPRK